MNEMQGTQDAAGTEARQSIAAGGDVRAQVRELTLRLLREHRLDSAAAAAALKSITAGVAAGVADKPADAKRLLSEAFAGTDEALAKVATATRLALLELYGSGKTLAADEWKPALRQLGELEGKLIDAYAAAARTTVGAAKDELLALVEHARRAGTDTGAAARSALGGLPHELTQLAGAAMSGGLAAAGELSARMLDATIGALEGLSESLKQKR